MSATLEILWTIAVVLAVCASAVGWGHWVWRIAAGRGHPGLGLLGALGLAALSLLGGLLDSFGWISRTSIVLLILAGWSGAGASALDKRPFERVRIAMGRRLRISLLGGYVLALFVLLLPLVSNLGTTWGETYNAVDDFQAYLAFPVRMLANGELGEDPFCFRRVAPGLGGQAFLQAILLVFLPLHRLHSLEWGIGLLTLVVLVLEHARDSGLGSRRTLGILCLLALAPWPIVNTTSVITGAALFYALHRLLSIACASGTRGVGSRAEWTVTERGGRVLVAVLGAGLTSLKSSHAVGAGVLVVASAFVVQPGVRFWFRAARLAFVPVLIGVFLAPWSIGMWKSSGTFLYPIFGLGVMASAVRNPDTRTAWELFLELGRVLTTPVSACTLLVGGLGLLLSPRRSSVRPHIAVATLAVPLSAALIWALSPPVAVGHLHRYSFALGLSTFAFLGVLGLGQKHGASEPLARRSRLATAAALVLFSLQHLPQAGARTRNEWFMLNYGRQFDRAYNFDSASSPLRALQSVAPPGQPILAHTDQPFLFDQGRNPILQLDIPGTASPPPGLPVRGSAEEIARYLRDVGIRFVAFSYAPTSSRRHPYGLEGSGFSGGTLLQFRLLELGSSYVRIADLNDTFLLDLCTRANSGKLPSPNVCAKESLSGRSVSP